MKICGCTISWATKKQSTVALSTAEAEYMAVSAATQETLWVRSLLREMMGTSRVSSPSIIYCDNAAAVAISQDDKHHQRTKHIDIRHHFIRDYVKKGVITVVWTPTQHQTADALTKPLSKIKFEQHTNAILDSTHKY